ncbi:MAG: exo-beta-N-acetylmuramidase NamZ domain-containing protein [Chthoniobacteraceae bacterium]
MKAHRIAAVLISFVAVAAADDPTRAFHADSLAQIDAAISLAISDGRCPGSVLWLERRGVAYHRAFGQRAIEPQREAMREDTIFDAASLTKVIATTTALMRLVEKGRVEIEKPVSVYLPEFRGAGKETITVRQLLTHTSGLRPGLPQKPEWTGADAALALACAQPLPDAPGSVLRYSDINFIVLGALVARVSGQPLDQFCAAEIFAPLEMRDTSFRPAGALHARVAPTTRDVARGVVHDPTARRMGGVAGHAGLFTTAADLARFARMLLARGGKILSPESVALMTGVQTPAQIAGRRGLGWDIDSSYSGPRGSWFPLGSFGHTGWTGTSVWIDPFSETFVIFLSNRNHPTESGNVQPLRRVIGTLAAEAVRDFNFLHVPGALAWQPGGTSASAPTASSTTPVLAGIDVLARDRFAALRGMKIGLITNHTGIDRERRATIDLLHKAPDVQLVALFSPEHGLRGTLDEKIADSRDERTGLPIHSLYGEKRTPTAEQLAGLDALVFDIADVGCRFYTYISTLGECLTAAQRAGKKFIVLDRPNPITGARVEGPMLAGERSFTAWHELPVRHGMTVGELAKMFAAERAPGVDLTVVACEGWSRGAWFDETALPWIDPSPNMRNLTAATLYPGVGLIEFCNVSVGRGTDRPFELLGAPYIDDRALAAAINAAGLPGVRAIPARFTPRASAFAGQECAGVQLLVTARDAFSPLDLGVVLATTLHRMHPQELKIERLGKLLAHPASLAAIRSGESLAAVKALWAGERERFRERREKFLIYR